LTGPPAAGQMATAAVASTRRRGVVIAFAPRAGTRLKPGAPVALPVSRGPGPRTQR
jgi:beta-lactam-binding protein with PASTA domain